MTARAFLTAALMLGSGAAAVKLPAPEVLREHGVCLHRQAFTPAECDRIVEQFSLLDAQRDVRVEESVSRTNFFDTENAGGGAYDWIYDRILRFARVEAGGAAVEWGFDLARDVRTPNDLASKGLVDFVLMHEFHAGDFFDWHVDTKPNDGTGRTVNINVMLSDATEYEGGGLSVGGHAVGAKKGDLYWSVRPTNTRESARGLAAVEGTALGSNTGPPPEPPRPRPVRVTSSRIPGL